jgi:phosphoglycolate phosphatase
MQKKELIIFDMDGTLIDSGNVITNTVNFVRGHLGLPSMPKEEMLAHMNNPDINAADFFYGTEAFTDEQTELFTEYYDKHCISDIELYDGIIDMLEETSKYFSLSVATNASAPFAKKMIEFLKIDKYFDFIIGADCVENPKPHPDMIIETLNKLDKSNTKAILVGDSHKDTRAATAANIDSLLVQWGFSDHSESNYDAIHEVNELTNRLLSYK